MRRWMRSMAVAAMLPVSAWANPFASLPLLPSGETTATGKTLFSLENGDYIQPHFSPDSRYLAFAREVLEGATELTEILVLDLKSLKVKTLLDARASREFAVYKSFVAGFSWKNATTLKASISDGDVNGVDLIFDAVTGTLIEKQPLSTADETTQRESTSAPELTTAFPSIPRPVLENALINGYKIGENKYIVQKNYWKQDNHIWYLDAGRKEPIKLVDIPETWIYSLRGAFASSNSFIMLVAYHREAYLVRHSSGGLELLYRFPVNNYQQTFMRAEYAHRDQVAFQINTGPRYEKRENYFFVYDRTGLKKVKDVASFYDLDIDSAGKLVCLSVWNGNKRTLVLKELRVSR